MEKTMKIEGMMCGHCEARVKKVLEALPEVSEAAVSHEAGTAVVTLSAPVADDVLKKALRIRITRCCPSSDGQMKRLPGHGRPTAAFCPCLEDRPAHFG